MLWAEGSGHCRYPPVAVFLSVERGRPGSGFHPRACSAAHVAPCVSPSCCLIHLLALHCTALNQNTCNGKEMALAVSLMPETTGVNDAMQSLSIVSHCT